jgi:energy-coupling factor transport system ATP-binding protein
MISLRNVSVVLPPRSPDPKTVLDDVSLDIGPGEWLAVAGPNGSGKTTLLHTIAGLIELSAGGIDRAPHNRAALLLQEPDDQFVTTTVLHELQLSLPEETAGEDREERIRSAASRFDLARLLERNPHRLSGGEKQRLALATVWLCDPAVLLLDEPTSYLDTESAALCLEFVGEAARRGTAVLWATPGGAEMERAGRVVCLGEGRVVYDGGLEAFFGWAREHDFEYARSPLRALAGELAAAAPGEAAAATIMEAVPDGVAGLATAVAPLIRAQKAEEKEGAGRADEGGDSGRVAVRLAGATYGYGGSPVVSNLDLTVGEGECVGLTGPNGAGKSTVLGLVAGMFDPEAGEVRRGGPDEGPSGRRDVFFLFQSPERLFFAESVAEELAFGLDRLGVAPAEREARSRAALDDVGLNPDVFLSRAPLTLSPGEMRRVAFAIALSLAPRLLLLDEPTSCLDDHARAVLESIVASRQSRGETTVVASHDVPFLAGVCDRMLWLRAGAVETELDTSGARLNPGTAWPGERPPVLALQERLSRLGVEVVPRFLTPAGLAGRLL